MTKTIKIPSSVGETLKEARLKKGYTISEISKKILIGENYLRKIEEGGYDGLPPDVYVRNFVKNYAEFLKLDAPALVRFFDKEKQVLNNFSLPPKTSLPHRFFLKKIYITPKILTFLAIGVIFFIVVGYFWHQINFFLSPPKLIIENPPQDMEISEKIIYIKGKTDFDAKLFINNSLVYLNDKGEFNQPIDLNSGLNILEVKAVSKIGKESKIIRRIINKPR